MTAVGAFTVTKENVEDDRALLKTGVIGTGTEVGGGYFDIICFGR